MVYHGGPFFPVVRSCALIPDVNVGWVLGHDTRGALALGDDPLLEDHL